MKVKFNIDPAPQSITSLTPGMYKDAVGRLLIVAQKPKYCPINKHWLGVIVIYDEMPGLIINADFNAQPYTPVDSVTIES